MRRLVVPVLILTLTASASAGDFPVIAPLILRTLPPGRSPSPAYREQLAKQSARNRQQAQAKREREAAYVAREKAAMRPAPPSGGLVRYNQAELIKHSKAGFCGHVNPGKGFCTNRRAGESVYCSEHPGG